MDKGTLIKVTLLATILLLRNKAQCALTRRIRPPTTTPVSAQFPRLSFSEGFLVEYGAPKNIRYFKGGYITELILNKYTGAGFISKDDYYYGYFNAAIKLPTSYTTAGVVVAFYASNAGVYPRSHDELDFEFLGHTPRNGWILQTNLYGNGSTYMGREERFHLWFDHPAGFHDYSILWTHNHIVFSVDDIPIREVVRNRAMGAQYPSKAMSVYSTIWDGSRWATNGGKYPVNYRYSPFTTFFTNLKLDGCVQNPTQSYPLCTPRPRSANPRFKSLDIRQRYAMNWARRNYMTYSYCHDKSRYSVAPPECKASTTASEMSILTQFAKFGRSTFSEEPLRIQ